MEDTGSRTEIRAKVWPENAAEPAAWQVDCYDSNSSRLTAGITGVWSYLSGSKYWDDLTVTPLGSLPLQYELALDTVGDGSVELNPPSGTYNEGTVVELTAVADPGSAFDSWSGDITGTANPVTITMNADISVSANFEVVPVPQFTITEDIVGDGSVVLEPPGGTYNEGTVVELTAVADPGSAFDSWSGDITGAANPVTITMNADIAVTANFEAVPQFTLTADTVGEGSVELDPPGGTYNEGTVVQLTAVADPGSAFDSWSGDITGTANPVTITMNADMAVTAIFEVVPQFTLTADTVGEGSVELDPPGGTYNEGTVVELTAVADPGSAFDSWSGDITGAANPVTITMDADMTVTSNFEAVPLPQFTLALEIGDIKLNHNWVRVNFTEAFVDPVVVAKPISLNGSHPAVIRINNLDSGGFDIRIQEWDYLDGSHTQETVSYLVMEKGNFTLDDGTQIEAGRLETDNTGSFGKFNFYQSFPDTPVVLAGVSSFNEPDAVTGRLRNISNQGFEFCMQEQELNPKEHLSETVDYIAWQPSIGNLNGYTFEVNKTANKVKDSFFTIEFEQPFGRVPFFLADMQTTDGGDTANVRWQNKNNSSVEVQIDEEQSKNSETGHTTEVVGYIVFAY